MYLLYAGCDSKNDDDSASGKEPDFPKHRPFFKKEQEFIGITGRAHIRDVSAGDAING